MKNILTKLVELWNRFICESEEWEYFEYLRRYPDRTPLIEGKTKAELAQELHNWKMRSRLRYIIQIMCYKDGRREFHYSDGHVEAWENDGQLLNFELPAQTGECLEPQKLDISGLPNLR